MNDHRKYNCYCQQNIYLKTVKIVIMCLYYVGYKINGNIVENYNIKKIEAYGSKLQYERQLRNKELRTCREVISTPINYSVIVIVTKIYKYINICREFFYHRYFLLLLTVACGVDKNVRNLYIAA